MLWRVGHPLIAYTAFIAGTCTACLILVSVTASNYWSAPKMAATKQPTGYSRVEGWLRRQATANLRKNLTPVEAPYRPAASNAGNANWDPEREVAHALVMAAAIDVAEHAAERAAVHVNVTSAVTPAAELRSRVRPLHRRLRVPTCHVLPCESTRTVALQTVEAGSQLEYPVKHKITRARVGSADRAAPRFANIAAVTTADAPPAKKLKGPPKPKTAAKRAYQVRLKSERKFALRRFRETPAEISYRSFVGTFVPAI